MSPDPCELFDRLASGDPGALEEVCRRYGGRASRIASRKLGRSLRARVETADIAQEAMLDLVRSPGRQRFPSEASFLAWLNVVVERKVIKAARRWHASRRNIAREVGPHPALGDLAGEGTTPSQACAREERADALAAAIHSLSPADRALVISRLLLRLPWAAVARVVGASEAAAQMRLLRVRKRLARRLAGLWAL